MPEIIRKVYIASSKDADVRDQVFGFLGTDFDVSTADPGEAELIVIDCKDSVELASWIRAYAEFVIPTVCCPPIVLVALDGEANPSFLGQLAGAYGRIATRFPIVKTQEDLQNTLTWLRSVLPFYNTRNLPVAAERIHLETISVMKMRMAALPPSLVQG